MLIKNVHLWENSELSENKNYKSDIWVSDLFFDVHDISIGKFNVFNDLPGF